jgi:AraC-like DNA-binding protein
VPIRWQGLHLGTLYAGTWRTQRLNQAGRSLGDAWQQAWRSLPVWDPTLEARWTSVQSTFADGFAQAISRAQERTAVGDRGAMLNTWFNLHYHLPVGLPDLAEHLGRSVSRAGAIVRETYGMPFALVLRRFRMDRAKHLLLTTVDPVAAIAQTVGYDDPAWFSRAFRQHSGHSPRAWRLRQTKSHP